MSDRIGGVSAVAQQLLERRVALEKLILLEGIQEIQEWPRRNAKTADGFGEGDHHRMPRRALVAAPQLLAPPAEQLERPRAAAGFIRQVVRPTAIGIHRVKMTQQ